MNNTASYQCQLRVYRCTYFDENNEFLNGCARGALYLPFYYGPVTSLRELERRHTLVVPENNEVPVGEVATFTCGAFGSSIALFWQFNNSLLNCNESDCDNTAASVQETIGNVDENITIKSTLEINTEGLSQSVFIVACVITQDIPRGVPTGTFSRTLIIGNPGIC